MGMGLLRSLGKLVVKRDVGVLLILIGRGMQLG